MIISFSFSVLYFLYPPPKRLLTKSVKPAKAVLIVKTSKLPRLLSNSFETVAIVDQKRIEIAAYKYDFFIQCFSVNGDVRGGDGGDGARHGDQLCSSVRGNFRPGPLSPKLHGQYYAPIVHGELYALYRLNFR